ncbi:hypothetical protein [Flavobacterium sp. UBA6195]|mgnify:CR=1 FL=1|uniref:hypothetical protein n=1 Tax=Flavobacterium sp. UBA6195 TaxID=1946554 RepID=UPI0025BF2D5C|nr:hypothetical protein [Flavobacterium sp. UBA6195]
MNSIFELIDKESITHLNFPQIDVLKDKEEMIARINDLDRALSLGNLEHLKIKIYFEDDTSKKVVETTIWGVTEERVILKQGVVIPVKRIHKII